MLSYLRKKVYRIVTRLYPWFLKAAYGMDIGQNVIISRTAKLDRAINPHGIHIGSSMTTAVDLRRIRISEKIV